MSAPKKTEFQVVFEAKGRAVGKMRNEIDLTWVKEGAENETFSMATDEGPFHGGDNTAPPPLAYFATGLVGCLMTQIRAFSKRLTVPLDGLEMSGRFVWGGEQEGRAPYVTKPVTFQLDVNMGSSASVEDQHRLLEAAKRGCFLEQTLSIGVDVKHRLRSENGWIAVD